MRLCEWRLKQTRRLVVVLEVAGLVRHCRLGRPWLVRMVVVVSWVVSRLRLRMRLLEAA